MHQVRILGRADTWASHGNVQRCEQEWEEIKSSCRETTNSPSCFSNDRDTTHSSYNITFSRMEDVIQTDPQLMSASRDNKIFSRDPCSNKGEEATHSSDKVTSSSSSILEDMQDSPGYDSTTEDKIAVILPNGKKLLVACQKPVLPKKLKEVCVHPVRCQWQCVPVPKERGQYSGAV